jgi:hypothetical protein
LPFRKDLCQYSRSSPFQSSAIPKRLSSHAFLLFYVGNNCRRYFVLDFRSAHQVFIALSSLNSSIFSSEFPKLYEMAIVDALFVYRQGLAQEFTQLNMPVAYTALYIFKPHW